MDASGNIIEPSSHAPPVNKEIRLMDVPVTDDNVALNLFVGFLNTAQKRGAFTIDESAKIWECIKHFQKS